jgi:hypothetical protein
MLELDEAVRLKNPINNAQVLVAMKRSRRLSCLIGCPDRVVPFTS